MRQRCCKTDYLQRLKVIEVPVADEQILNRTRIDAVFVQRSRGVVVEIDQQVGSQVIAGVSAQILWGQLCGIRTAEIGIPCTGPEKLEVARLIHICLQGRLREHIGRDGPAAEEATPGQRPAAAPGPPDRTPFQAIIAFSCRPSLVPSGYLSRVKAGLRVHACSRKCLRIPSWLYCGPCGFQSL